jgi:hypothetical protein
VDSSPRAAKTNFACLQDFDDTSDYVIFSGVFPETDAEGAQSHVSRHTHGTQCGADLTGVTSRPDRKGHFVFEGELYFMADHSRKSDADYLNDKRWSRWDRCGWQKRRTSHIDVKIFS